jgi:plastocyanin
MSPQGAHKRRPGRGTTRCVRLAASVAVLLHLAGCASLREELPWWRPSHPPPLPPGPGEVAGSLASARSPDEPVVVYLEPIDVAEAHRADHTTTVRSRGDGFEPPFLVVAAGDSVRFLNPEEVYQQVFSSSAPNDFDTGLLERGESRTIVLRHPGVVQLYSPLHEGASGLVYVAPSPYFTVRRGPGRFRIQGVPPGRYRLHTWCEEGPRFQREIDVLSGARTALEIHAEATPR